MISIDFAYFYQQFNAPITELDCGKKCAPYNENCVPFCCDSHHAVPTAYLTEWDYLKENSDMWHVWDTNDHTEAECLRSETPEGQILIECRGHLFCQREYRSIVCRAFPFFPYITRQGDFIGLSYYWMYEDRCWIISNLDRVIPQYVTEFVTAFETLFAELPSERENFRFHAIIMRRVFGRRGCSLPLLHRDGYTADVIPRTGEVRLVDPKNWPKHGPYQFMDKLPFPDELMS